MCYLYILGKGKTPHTDDNECWDTHAVETFLISAKKLGALLSCNLWNVTSVVAMRKEKVTGVRK